MINSLEHWLREFQCTISFITLLLTIESQNGRLHVCLSTLKISQLAAIKEVCVFSSPSSTHHFFYIPIHSVSVVGWNCPNK